MPRSIEEWIGKTDDAAIPPRVRLRVFERFNGCCGQCQRKLYPGDKWQLDHNIAIINGGEHRELNLHPLCDWCHKIKTKADIAIKSETARVRAKHLGIKKRASFRGWRKFNGELVYARRS